jgi:hypothetical protein
MKLTIEIPDAHTGDLLQFLASISAKQVDAPEPEDPTMREVGIPKGYYPLPDLPKGKSRWVGRGRFGGQFVSGNGREIYYYYSGDKQWKGCIDFSYHVFHIEAV